MSRKIDALVAEHVMGLTIIKDVDEFPFDWVANHEWKIGEPKIYVTPEVWNKHYKVSSVQWGMDLIPCYSTDIAAAWEVVEKFPYYQLVTGPGVEHELHACQFAGTDMQVWSFSATAPMAICLAALKAKGVEVDDKQ